jgi:hypothetical protein
MVAITWSQRTSTDLRLAKPFQLRSGRCVK